MEKKYEEFLREYNLENLNKVQQEAMFCHGGPIMVLAVPGSGKTTTMLAAIAARVSCYGVNPKNILALTFSRPAANEMKERYKTKYEGLCHNGTPIFSTIHAFCYKVNKLVERQYGLNIGELCDDNRGIIIGIAKEYTKPEFPSESLINNLQSRITYYKNKMITRGSIDKTDMVESISVREFFGKYEDEMVKRKLIDFDDMLIYAYRFLCDKGISEVLQYYQNLYKHVFVDEYQDTSLIQHKIIHKLVNREKQEPNIFMVGDDDQSIYGFRGAEPSLMLEIEKYYPSIKKFTLNINYRSSKEIISKSDRFIKINKLRYEKKMSAAENASDNLSISIKELDDYINQYTYAVNEAKEAIAKGQTIAFLYRNNDSGIPLLSKFIKAGIDVSYRNRNPSSFFTNSVVKAVISLLKLVVVNEKDTEAFANCYYYLGLYLSRKDYEEICTYVKYNNVPVFEALYVLYKENRKEVTQIWNTYNSLKKLSSSDAIYTIMYEMNFFEVILSKDSKESDSPNLFRMYYLQSIARDCNSIAELLSHLERIEKYKSNSDSNIELSTFHSAKGLEYYKVIIVDLLEKIIPLETKDMTQLEKEEDARLFYVACTRAMNSLILIKANRYCGMYEKPSCFLEYLITGPKEKQKVEKLDTRKPLFSRDKKSKERHKSLSGDALTSFSKGQEVNHTKYGLAIVVAVEDNRIKIRLKETGEVKTLDIQTCIQGAILRKGK